MESRVARTSVIVAALLGTVALGAALLVALRPTPKPRKLTSVNISALAPGKWMSIDSDRLRFYVLRPLAADAYAVATPLDDGKVPLPEVYWWKPYMSCADFGLDMPNGVVDADARFRCRDANLPEEWATRWLWDARGKHVPTPAGKIDNLYGVRVERDGDELIFVGLQPD